MQQDSFVFDFHTHHDRCGHAEGKVEDYVQSAIKQGMHLIGISDHTPYFHSEQDQLRPGIAMAKSELTKYVEEVLYLKEKYADKITVLLGIESDYFPNHIDVYRQELLKYPFDYMIGSVHFVDDISIFKKERWDGLTDAEKVKTKESYYQLIEASARSGLFQILGHLDAMKGFYPEFSAIETEAVNQTLKVIGEQELVIEINTSGKTKDCGGWYPSEEMLERALFYQVGVTFGYDAHDPSRVGDEFEQVKVKLKEIGFKEMAYFINKKRYHMTI